MEPVDIVIVASFVTSFFWLKIWMQHLLSGPGAGRKIAPEDIATFKIDVPDDQEEIAEFTNKDRWTRIAANDEENIQWTLFLIWGNLVVGNSTAVDVTGYATILFVFFRIVYTVLYRCGINTLFLRTLTFGFGQFCGLTLAIILPVGAILNKP
mmetsp:Transcript_20848/g.33354  ORF Transcript_20848/g.33354 Transcript_20848/m.33354 type:complete len:153 (-) Transcript_20848:156-614(-)